MTSRVHLKLIHSIASTIPHALLSLHMLVKIVLHFENLKTMVYAHNQLEVCHAPTSKIRWHIGHTSCSDHKWYFEQHGPTPNRYCKKQTFVFQVHGLKVHEFHPTMTLWTGTMTNFLSWCFHKLSNLMVKNLIFLSNLYFYLCPHHIPRSMCEICIMKEIFCRSDFSHFD